MPFNSTQICVDFKNWLIRGSNLRISDETTKWTKGIKEFFADYGTDLGYEVKYTSTYKKEYLVDLVWQVNIPNRYIYLALESELSKRKKEILYDFQKLLDIKSYKKIGIFKLNTNVVYDDYLQIILDLTQTQILWLQDETIVIIFYKFIDNSMMELKCYLVDMLGSIRDIIIEEQLPLPP